MRYNTIDLDYMDIADIVVHAISHGTEWSFLRSFLPLSGRERIDLDLGTIIELDRLISCSNSMVQSKLFVQYNGLR